MKNSINPSANEFCSIGLPRLPIDQKSTRVVLRQDVSTPVPGGSLALLAELPFPLLPPPAHILKPHICCKFLLECEARHRGVKKSPMPVHLGILSDEQGPRKEAAEIQRSILFA